MNIMKKLILSLIAACAVNGLYAELFENELDLVATDSRRLESQEPSDAELAEFEAQLAKMSAEAEAAQEAEVRAEDREDGDGEEDNIEEEVARLLREEREERREESAPREEIVIVEEEDNDDQE